MKAKLDGKVIKEQIKVASGELVDAVKKIVAEGRAHEVVIRDGGGKVNLKVSFNKATAVGAVAVLGAPLLSAIGAIAALATDHTIEIKRNKK
jgi:exonuclease VII large subunit